MKLVKFIIIRKKKPSGLQTHLDLLYINLIYLANARKIKVLSNSSRSWISAFRELWKLKQRNKVKLGKLKREREKWEREVVKPDNSINDSINYTDVLYIKASVNI